MRGVGMKINQHNKPVKLWLIDWGKQCTKGRYAIISTPEEQDCLRKADAFDIWRSIDRYADPSDVKFRPIGTNHGEGDSPWLYIEILPKGQYEFQSLCDDDSNWRTFKKYKKELKKYNRCVDKLCHD
jgi:hypothetical protein